VDPDDELFPLTPATTEELNGSHNDDDDDDSNIGQQILDCPF